MSTRQNFLTILKPLLPSGWRLDPSRSPRDAFSKPTVRVSRMQTLKDTPEAPQGARTARFLVTLIEPDTDVDQGGERIENAVEQLLTAIEGCPNQISHKGATAVQWGDKYPNAYDIPVDVITSKE